MINVKRWAFALFTSALIAAIVGIIVIPAAFAQRGYMACGGEWLLVLLSFVASLWVLTGNE